MNFVRPPRAVSVELVLGVMLGVIALSLLVMGCTRSPVPPEPNFVIVDAADAEALKDVGADASQCSLACARLAILGCREARGNCVSTCDLSVEARLIHAETLACVVAASDRTSLQACGTFCQ